MTEDEANEIREIFHRTDCGPVEFKRVKELFKIMNERELMDHAFSRGYFGTWVSAHKAAINAYAKEDGFRDPPR